MALISSSPGAGQATGRSKKKPTFWEGQQLAKQKAYEKQTKKKKIKLESLTVFTNQLASMLDAGLPLVSAFEALQEQTEDPVFQLIIRDVRNDVASGTAFSDAVRKYPNCFPNLFISMVEAGEASGGLAGILAKVAVYFEGTVKLIKKVKGAMTYPVAVIGLAVGLVNVLLVFVIPVFAEMFADFGADLPKPTQFLIDLSNFLKAYIIHMIISAVVGYKLLMKGIATPRGRVMKDQVLFRVPLVGGLIQKISVARFCRTYAILLRSGVPILRSLEIVSAASGTTYIENACHLFVRHISQGGQFSEVVAEVEYFPNMIKHMAKAGEQTGNVDGMLDKIADFYETEIDTTVDALTSLMEPILICFLGIVIGGIVMAMFLPIFQLSSVVSQ